MAAVAAKSRNGAVRAMTQPVDIARAVKAIHRVPPRLQPAVRAHLIRKAAGIAGASRHIPAHWHPSGKIRQISREHALKLAAEAGVTIDLSNADIDLAGRWKHGWIPLDAVASLVKAKKYHGGSEGRSEKDRALRSVGARSKGRAGRAVMDSRRQSLGRAKVGKGKVPERRLRAEHRDGPGGRAHLADLESYNRGHVGKNDPAEMAKLLPESQLGTMRDRMPNTLEGRTAKAELERRGREAKLAEIASAVGRGEISTRRADKLAAAAGGAVPTGRADGSKLTASKSVSVMPARREAGLGTKTPDFDNPNRRKVATERAQRVAQDRTRRLMNEHVQAEEHSIHSAPTADLLAEVKAFDDNPPSIRSMPSAEYRQRVVRYNAAKNELRSREIPGARSGGTAGGGYNEAKGSGLEGRSAASMSAAEKARAAEVMHGSKLPADSAFDVEKGGTGWHAVRKGGPGQSSHSIGFHKTKKAAMAHAVDSHNAAVRAQAASPSLTELDAADAAKADQHQSAIFSRMSDAELAQAKARQTSPRMQRLIAQEEAHRGGTGTAKPPVRGKVRRYVLERTLPDGTVKRSEPATLAEAERSMMGVLHYNQGVSKGEAGRLAPQLRHAPVGQHVEAHGYKFRLVEPGGHLPLPMRADQGAGSQGVHADSVAKDAAPLAANARRSEALRAGAGDRNPTFASYSVSSLRSMAEGQMGARSLDAAAELRARGFVRTGGALTGKWKREGK